MDSDLLLRYCMQYLVLAANESTCSIPIALEAVSIDFFLYRPVHAVVTSICSCIGSISKCHIFSKVCCIPIVSPEMTLHGIRLPN